MTDKDKNAHLWDRKCWHANVTSCSLYSNNWAQEQQEEIHGIYKRESTFIDKKEDDKKATLGRVKEWNRRLEMIQERESIQLAASCFSVLGQLMGQWCMAISSDHLQHESTTV